MATATREAELTEAAQQLAKSDNGRQALRAILIWLEGAGLSLDQTNQDACLTLLIAAWTDCPGTARQSMRKALGIA